MIIHVSGTTGSGKTYLGNFMSQIYNRKKLVVVDLDTLFHLILDVHPDASFEVIEKELKSYISRITKKFDNTLLVGYSDVKVDGKIKFIDVHPDKRYFIDIPLEDLIRQYNKRADKQVLGTRNKVVRLTDVAIKRMVASDHKMYSQYRWMPQKSIIKDIILNLK